METTERTEESLGLPNVMVTGYNFQTFLNIRENMMESMIITDIFTSYTATKSLKPGKKLRGFKPITSAIPVQCSTN